MNEPEQRSSPPVDPKQPARDTFEKAWAPEPDSTPGVTELLGRIFHGVKA